MEVYYGYDTPSNSTLLGTADVSRRSGSWEVVIRSSRRNRLDPVPCAVSATLRRQAPVSDFPVSGAPDNCAPKPTGGNTPPTANNDAASTDQEVAVTINVLANDTDPDGDTLRVASVTQGANGSVTNNGTNVTYTPNSGFIGTDSFTYVATDGTANSNPATVTVTVNQVVSNSPPVCSINTPATNQTITVGNSINYTGTVIDPNAGDTLTIRWAFPGGTPATSSLEDPGSVVYNTAGTFTTTLNASDNHGASCAQQTRTITVQPGQQSVCNISVTPTALAFGNVNVGSSSTLTSTLRNSGAAACTGSLVRTGSTDFAVNATSINLAPGASQNVPVTYTPSAAGADSGNIAVNSNDPDSPTVSVSLSGNGVVQQAQCVPADINTSINSTSQNGCPDGMVPQQPIVNNATSSYGVLAINDLGMHCGDLDTRIASILPPFQVLLAQVVQKGSTPTLNPNGANVYYSAASNPNDPILNPANPDNLINLFEGVMANGDTYKTNFWTSAIAGGSYNAFYPFDIDALMTDDLGLPVPNLEILYIDNNGNVVPGGTGIIDAVQHAMPGMPPYVGNVPQRVQEHYLDKPFFVDFPFGYVAADVNWFEGAGIPFAAFDDNGRENAYPMVRVQVTTDGNAPNASASNVVASVDTVLPISGEASCTNCHAEAVDYESVEGVPPRTQNPIDALGTLPVATSLDDLETNLPPRVSLEYAADINVLRLHDLKHGARYVNTDCDGVPTGENCLANPAIADPCTISAANPNGSASCLTNQALVQNKPVVCQVCHYTPALDLAHVGPQAGAPGTEANGRNQMAHESNSRVMHNFHGQFTSLFTPIPVPAQNPDGSIQNQSARITALENNCYQCHPGTNVRCLRGAMFDGGMLCSDCHGDIRQVGNDFSAGVAPDNAGAFNLTTGNFYDPNSGQPRVPWANEPGCGSCHTGDAVDNLAGAGSVRVNLRDTHGNLDNIRLRQAYRTGDAKATPIVPSNTRFAENPIPTSFNGFTNPGAGIIPNTNGAENPKLYRVSNGHGGVMCEGCHGATHAEFDSDAPSLRNDDVTAQQLQGHAGTIADCTTCHANNVPGGSNDLNGPHGLHRIAFNSTPWSSSSVHRSLGGNYTANCQACHGGTSRSNSCGTVLSRALADRSFSGRTILAGDPVGCAVCHNSSYWTSTCMTQ